MNTMRTLCRTRSSFFTNQIININNIYPSPSLVDIPIHSEAIYDRLHQLDASKSPGPDRWYPRFFKESAEQL